MSLSEKTAIATTTMYPGKTEADRVRSTLALQTVEAARKLGYGLVVVDQQSTDQFRKSIEDLGAKLIVLEQGDMCESRRTAIQGAYDTNRPYLCWTEPEKVDYVKSIELTLLLLEQGADLVVPRRLSLRSYPAFQQLTERTMNGSFEVLTGRPLDVTFGPKSWRREVTNYFVGYEKSSDGEYGITFIPLVYMLADGKQLRSVAVDYEHPQEQTRLEEGNPSFDRKRVTQLVSIAGNIQR